VEAAGLRFEPLGAGGQPFLLPFEGLSVRLGGASDRVLFFEHPRFPEVSAFTTDRGILQHPGLADNPLVAEQLAGVRSRRQRNHATGLALVAALVLAVLGLFALKDPLVRLVASQVPASAEVKLGDIAFGQVQTGYVMLRDEELERDLQTLVAPLLESLPETEYPFRFHLVEDPTLNAFALPGGHVVLHSGLVLEAESPEEVLGVLAHEIAHVTRRHSLNQLISSAGLFVIVQAVLGDLSGVAALAADGGLRLLTLDFSRDQERDADATGFDYLVAADIDPRGMITTFVRLEETVEEMGAQTPEGLEFLRTHPTSEDRILRLEERLREVEDQRFPPVRFDLDAFQEKIHSATRDNP
jgi:predicted Zn-dependent protease